MEYKNERITLERIGVFTGWKDFNGFVERPTFAEVLKSTTFTPTKIGTKFGPSWTTFWFRVDIHAKEHGDQELHLVWDSSSEAMVWTADGRPVQGLVGGTSWCRRVDFPLSLVEGSNCVYIEMACNGLFGVGRDGDIEPPDPEKTFEFKECAVAEFDRQAWDLLCDITFLEGCAADLPKGSSRRAMALRTANAIVNSVDVNNRDTWSNGQALVQDFRKDSVGTGQPTIYAAGHCHIDTAWLWPYEETVRKCARSWATQIANIKAYPEYKFVCSQAQQFKWIQDGYPSLFEEIQRLSAAGRFIVTGGTWVEMDCNLPCGESLVRQFLEGQRYFQKQFGVHCRLFWLPDTFGYAAQLPQIMKSAGIDFFLTQKLSWNLFNKFPHSVFHWEGLDGSRVISHFPPADSYCAFGKVDEVLRSVTNNKDIGVANGSILLFGHGDGGGGASPAMIESVTRMENVDGLPKVTIADPLEFFEGVEKRQQELPRWVGELYFELHRGTYTSQAKIKKGNRQCEIFLRETEIFSTIERMWTKGRSYETAAVATENHDKLQEIWRKVLLHQFHDTLPGSCIRDVVETAERDHDSVISELRGKLSSSLTALSNTIGEMCELDPAHSESSSVPLVVVNPCGFPPVHNVVECSLTSEDASRLEHGSLQAIGSRSDAFSDVEQYLILVDTEPLVGIGISTFPRLAPKVAPHEECKVLISDDGIISLQNDCVVARFSAQGKLKNLLLCLSPPGGAVWDLMEGSREGNAFIIYDDVPLFWDAWDVEAYNFEKTHVSLTANHYKVVEHGPLRVGVEFHYTDYAGCKIVQQIYLEARSTRLTFATSIDWAESRKILRVEFPTCIRSPVASYETQYGFVQRPTHFNTSWDRAKFEVCGHRYADLSERNFGLTLLNDCKYGYSVRDGTMRLSLLRSPMSPDDLCDMGSHSLRYALFPHAGSFPNAAVVREAIAFNQASRVLQLMEWPRHLGQAKSHVWLAVRDPSLESSYSGGVILDCVKPAEDHSDTCMVLRLFESLGGSERLCLYIDPSLRIQQVLCSDVLEREREDSKQILLDKDGITEEIEFRPFEIRTFILRV